LTFKANEKEELGEEGSRHKESGVTEELREVYVDNGE